MHWDCTSLTLNTWSITDLELRASHLIHLTFRVPVDSTLFPLSRSQMPRSSADELQPRRGPREPRASGTRECVRIPATNEHLSKGVGDVSGEAPPMLKSNSESPISQAGEPWLPEPEELPTTPWYEEKASTLRLSDIPIIKEKGGTMGKFDVVIPHPDERAHRPPSGFHTFYMNQIEMGLRFPIPSYHELPLIPYVLMQLVQIKRLGPGKFYLSHKGDHTFIKGNPSSHKGWMSRFFYVKCDVMRDPWRCEMHWRDSAVTLVPRTPDRAPSLTPFLETMHGKSYNAPELIREDLMCFYKFSRKGVELVGDLDERMGKAELLRAMQEVAAAPPKKSTKRKAPSMVEKEARGEKRKKAGASTSGARTEEASKPKQAPTPPTSSSEEPLDVPPVSVIAGASSSGKGPERPLPFDPSKDSLVESPSAIVATRYICNMAPDRDRRPLRKALNADVVGHFSTNLAAKSYASLPVRNWAFVPSWSGLCVCVEELREFASAELSFMFASVKLGLCAQLGSSPEELDN
ncbi:hypothetical protein F511_30059 [Dorcoceras hygrometricum]|uniref:Uncharacterized protein n=1 Tax=Dorcoceras hygrometricum TaxID=472368 RepID=A0A2Z7B5C0_9LAMI|nr:hypothetical protein F511_30059 [Dorcoceras hygrometricum]